MTKIPWATRTWNPIKMRCTPVSDGCKNCWHLRMARRQVANPILNPNFREAANGGAPWLDEMELKAPLHWRKPQVVAVQLMGDLFHEKVSDEFIDRVFDVMYEAHQHTFLVLTKRPARMAKYVPAYYGRRNDSAQPGIARDTLPNLRLGVSVENDDNLWRVEELLRCPAAHRFVSLEPLLGPVDMRPGMFPSPVARLDSVIVGGESGPHARPLNPDWVRSVRDQCAAAGTPFMFKQDSAANKTWAATFQDVLGRSVKLPLLDGRVHADLGWKR